MLSLGGGAIGIVFAVFGIRLAGFLGRIALPLGQISLSMVGSPCVDPCVHAVGVALHPDHMVSLRDAASGCLQAKRRRNQPERPALAAWLIVTQIAVAFMLLCGAGLLSISSSDLEQSSGFESRQS